MSLPPVNLKNYDVIAGQLVTNNVKMTPYNLGTAILKGTVECYGDSITYGTGLSSPTTQRYTALLAAQYGFTESNLANPGDATQDMLARVYNNHVPGNTCIVKIGYNDVDINVNLFNVNDGTPKSIDTFYMIRDDFMAQMLYLCLSSSQLLSNRGSNTTRTGSWSSTSFTNGGSYTNTNGATVTANVTGRYIGFFLLCNIGSASTLTANVDGAGAVALTTYIPPTTPNSTTWGSLCWFFDTGSAAGVAHSIVVTSTSTTTLDIEFFFGFDNLSGSTNSPVVVLGLEPCSFQQTTANYAFGNLTRQYLIDQFQNKIVKMLRLQFGAKITFCEGLEFFSWGNKVADLIHPDKFGHIRLQVLVNSTLTNGEMINFV